MRGGYLLGLALVVLVLVLGLLGFAAAALAAPTSCGHTCQIRVARKACDRGKVTSCIRRAALHHRVSEGWMRSIAWCESRFKPWATNGIYQGLYQFGPALWSELRYRRYSRYSAKWSSLAAALALRRGLAYKWACA